MAKPGLERQMQYEARQKERDKEAYLKKRQEQKARQRAALKKDKVRYEALKAKDRERNYTKYTYTKFILHNSPVAWKGCVSGFQNPQTSVKKKHVISKILSNFSPTSKG